MSQTSWMIVGLDCWMIMDTLRCESFFLTTLKYFGLSEHELKRIHINIYWLEKICLFTLEFWRKSLFAVEFITYDTNEELLLCIVLGWPCCALCKAYINDNVIYEWCDMIFMWRGIYVFWYISINDLSSQIIVRSLLAENLFCPLCLGLLNFLINCLLLVPTTCFIFTFMFIWNSNKTSRKKVCWLKALPSVYSYNKKHANLTVSFARTCIYFYYLWFVR